MIFEATMDGEFPVGVEAEIAKLRRRDPDALAALIERYQYRLYRYLLRLVGSPTTAEDLFQQTWLRVVEKIRRYDTRRSFEAWLFSVARNLTIDHLRRRQPESLDEPPPSGKLLAERLPATSPDALEQFLQWERVNLLTEKIGELPAIHREVLTLRFEEEMKLEEISEVTGAPLSTVKSRLRRALESLRQRLETEFHGGEGR